MAYIKKAVLYVLCISLLLPVFLTINVFAESTYTDYFAGDNSGTNVPESIQYGDGSGSAGYGFYNGLYIEYDINLENTGYYKAEIECGFTEENVIVGLYIDGNVKNEITLAVTDKGSRSTNDLGEVYLQAGSYKFKLLCGGTGGTEYFKMRLSYSADDGKKPLELIIDPVSLEKISAGDMREYSSPYNGTVLGDASAYAEYTLNVPGGNYYLSICYGAYDSFGVMGLSVNGDSIGSYTLPQSNTFIHQPSYDLTSYKKIDLISLNEGENKIKLSCGMDSGVAKPYSYTTIKLTRITEPWVNMYSSGEKITQLKKGDLSVQSFIPAYAADKPLVMLSCIYKDDALYRVSVSDVPLASKNEVLSAEFYDVELLEDSRYECKFIYLEGLDDMTPLCAPVYLNEVYKNIYVSEKGSDDGDGSIENPFKTLSRAKEEIAAINDYMSGDIVVNILPGTYKISETEEFTPEHSGKNGYSVIICGTDNENKPVFDGGTEITLWEKHNDYIWKASLDGALDVRNLYINGFMAQRARSKYRYLPTVDYTKEGSENVNDGIGIKSANFPEVLSYPEDIELCWQNAWAFQITPVSAVERYDDMVYFIMDQPYYNWARSRTFLSTAPGAGRRFHIQNAFELLDEPGEFYHNKDEDTIYYYPFKNEVLNDVETVVGTTELMFKVTGTKDNPVTNLSFENISVKYGAWNEVSTTGMIVDQADKIINAPNSGTGHGGKMIPAQFDIKYSDGISIKDCEFSCLGSSAIAMSDGVFNSSIIGNKIHDISGSGIVIGHWDHNESHPEYEEHTQCSHINVSNNYITRVAYEFKGCIGISVYYEKNINILNNYLKDLAYSGITLGWGWGEEADASDIRVSYNRVENAVTPPVLDGGHIYTLGPLRNSEISYNYFTETDGEYGAIYPDSGSSYLSIHHNVVEGCNHWFFGGLYETHDIVAYDNYSDTEKFYDYGATDGYDGENNIQAVNLLGEEYPEEANAIIQGAGLSNEYQYLMEGLSYPEWRTDFVKSAPMNNFVVSDGTWYQAEDYNEGGQGIGYYKLRPTGSNTVYREGDVIMYRQEDDGAVSVGDTYPGEWLAYDIEIPADDTYRITVRGSYVPYNEIDPTAKVNIYIDGELIAENVDISETESWGVKVDNLIGEFKLGKGTHLLKLEFVDMGFAFDCFRVVTPKYADNPETTSPDYDEGKIVVEN